MIYKTIIAFSLITLSLNAKYIVDVTVIDGNAEAIEMAEVSVWFSHFRLNKRVSNTIVGLTDDSGNFVAQGDGQMGMGLFVTKEGYYSYGSRNGKRVEFYTKEPSTIKHTALLRRIKEPIPLYSKVITEATPFRPYKIPVEKEPIGFDFFVGDWVKPYGQGKVADILFSYEKEFVEFASIPSRTLEQVRESYKRRCKSEGIAYTEEGFREFAGKWDSKFEVSFPGEKEGIQMVEEQFNVHSALRMPHEAPEDGYKDGFTVEKLHTDEPRIARDDIGYFLRTRVKLDEDGEIESANYAKIYGEIEFLPTGYVYFHYYFNPTPNDRNLEFDTQRNLFGDDVEGSKVNLP